VDLLAAEMTAFGRVQSVLSSKWNRSLIQSPYKYREREALYDSRGRLNSPTDAEVVEAPSEEIRKEVLEFLARNGAELDFTKCFWKGCESLPIDVAQYGKFCKAISLLANGYKQVSVAKELGVNPNSVNGWSRMTSIPKLAHFLVALARMGEPEDDKVWLTMKQSHGHAVPIGAFLQVPKSISSWEDVQAVLAQVTPIGDPSKQFGKAYMFGFLVGMIIGDSHKPKQGRGHRHVELVLSKKYDTNVKIGDFTTYCANQLGLTMNRREDLPKPETKPHGFYHWSSQSSPLVDWIFNAVLGLNDGEHTTYDQVHLDWAFDAPHDFRLGLIQGIAESDGSVSIASQTVEFWVIPDWEFMIRLLETFGLKGFRNREAVSLVKTQAIQAFKVPIFAEHLQTVRYQRHKVIAETPKLSKKERLPQDVREAIGGLAAEGLSVPKIVERIAETKFLLVSFEAAQRWVRNSERAEYAPHAEEKPR